MFSLTKCRNIFHRNIKGLKNYLFNHILQGIRLYVLPVRGILKKFNKYIL